MKEILFSAVDTKRRTVRLVLETGISRQGTGFSKWAWPVRLSAVSVPFQNLTAFLESDKWTDERCGGRWTVDEKWTVDRRCRGLRSRYGHTLALMIEETREDRVEIPVDDLKALSVSAFEQDALEKAAASVPEHDSALRSRLM